MPGSFDFKPEQVQALIDSWKTRLFYLEQQHARYGLNTPPEILTEIKVISEETIPQFQEALKDVKEETVTPSVRQKVYSLDQRISKLASEYSGIRFINREVELKEITDPLSRPFILIDAPAFYGKTFLLHRVKEVLEDKKWLVCLIDFATHTEATRKKLAFIHAVDACIPGRHVELSEEIDRALSSVIGRLSRLGQPVALLLDSAELIPSADYAEWLRNDFIYQMAETVRNIPTCNFRCIVAGRYISQSWTDPRRKYMLGAECFGEPIRLSAFTFEVILGTVDRLAHRGGNHRGPGDVLEPVISAPTRDAMENVAREVHMISGGHPKCIVSLLSEIDAEHGLNPTSRYLNDHASLFDRHVLSVYHDILWDLPAVLVSFFPYLCLVRCYNQQVVQAVLSWANENEKLPVERHWGQVFQALTQRGLIIWQSRKRFYGDDMVRRVVATRQWLYDKESATALNDLALGLYAQWLESPPDFRSIRYKAMIVEHLFHLSVALVQLPERFSDQTAAFKEALVEDLACFQCFFEVRLDKLEWCELLRELLEDLRTDEEIVSAMCLVNSCGDHFEQLVAPLIDMICTLEGEGM